MLLQCQQHHKHPAAGSGTPKGMYLLHAANHQVVPHEHALRVVLRYMIP
jgi:hypothetical protein